MGAERERTTKYGKYRDERIKEGLEKEDLGNERNLTRETDRTGTLAQVPEPTGKYTEHFQLA